MNEYKVGQIIETFSHNQYLLIEKIDNLHYKAKYYKIVFEGAKTDSPEFFNVNNSKIIKQLNPLIIKILYGE